MSDTGTRPRPKRASELELLESEIELKESAVAELERRLAADWGDADAVAAHRRAREELESLLGRWEALFEKAQT